MFFFAEIPLILYHSLFYILLFYDYNSNKNILFVNYKHTFNVIFKVIKS